VNVAKPGCPTITRWLKWNIRGRGTVPFRSVSSVSSRAVTALWNSFPLPFRRVFEKSETRECMPWTVSLRCCGTLSAAVTFVSTKFTSVVYCYLLLCPCFMSTSCATVTIITLVSWSHQSRWWLECRTMGQLREWERLWSTSLIHSAVT